MNRIYQGRVTRVERLRPDAKNKGKKPEDWDDLSKGEWQVALWKHHELFQDAVNYYLVALTALADPEHTGIRLIKDLRSRVEAAWIEFPRSVGGEPVSLRQSVVRWLDVSKDGSLDDAFEAVLDSNEAVPKVRTLALALLLDQCGGESAIQQGGRGYLPRFCDSKAEPTYDFSEASLRSAMGKDRLAQALHGQPSKEELAGIAGELELSWTVKVQPGKFYAPEQSAARLVEAVEHIRSLLDQAGNRRIKEVKEQFPNYESQLNGFKATVEDALAGTPIPRNRRASKDLTFATLTFKHFPCALTAKLLSLFIKKPSTGSIGQSDDQVDFAGCGDDPIKLARGNRGYVFRAFTALPAWSPHSPGEPVWKEFDIAAFKETLKSLNQFNQKTQERIETEKDLRGHLAILLGSKVKGWKPRKTDAGEDEPTPEPLDPDLFRLARELERDLSDDLADTIVGEDETITFGETAYRFRESEWQISLAALRGYRDISEDWNQLHARLGEDLTTAHLEELVKNYQREEKNKKSVGSIPLFLRLCEEKYWPLWLADNEESDEPAPGRSFLHRMVSFHLKFRDFQRSLEPINLTPAEPTHSRRLYMFSDLKDKAAKVAFGESDRGFNIECAIAVQMNHGAVEERRVRLHYSGKRLLRDELLGGVESRWLQPMTRALNLPTPETENGKPFKSAVSLMPDPIGAAKKSETESIRFLLNFPVTLDPARIHASLGKAALWKSQFNGTREKNLHLHWPDTITGKGAERPWWKKTPIIEHGFTALSVDLGQRTAGAWALLHATCWDPRNDGKGTKRPVREIGFDGERVWFAEVITTGILRLPGEDQKQTNGEGRFEVERFGKAGRNALRAEWEEGKKLASDLLAERPEAWVGANVTEKSFPEQNDALIALANRRLSRLNTFHRWSCFDPDRSEVAARRANLIDRLVEELSHWQDVEVTRWKGLIEQGDLAEFRSAAGIGFQSLRRDLEAHLLALANRVAPLRNRSWKWDKSKGDRGQGLYGELWDTGPQLTPHPTWIRGQRGLSLSRIDQLENLRRLFLRYNRSFDREPGKPAKFGRADFGRKSGEPCRSLLNKIDRMKEQRVNQTAHLILAHALGVRLKAHQFDEVEREARDIHGEYEKIPDREPVDFIVIENLDRYLTTQGRAPTENSRLMKWAHRAVRDKIKMLAEEPFGVPVVETSAAYSSRFCSATGAAGARCGERTSLDDYLLESLKNRAKRPPRPGQPHPRDFETLIDQFTQLGKLNAALQEARKERRESGKSLHSLFIPKQGGPLFFAIGGSNRKTERAGQIPKQADINAAINIGLRALVAPSALSILHKIRAEKEGESFRPLRKNAREKAAFNSKATITMRDTVSAKLGKARNPNFFFDAEAFNCFDRANLELSSQTVRLVSGIGLWTTVNQSFVAQLVEINKVRLARWSEALSDDDVPTNYDQAP